MGVGDSQVSFFLIDFGIVQRYHDPSSCIHIPMQENLPLVGTPAFALLNSHRGLQLGHQDDIKSLAYSLIFLHHGLLPWLTVKTQVGLLAKTPETRSSLRRGTWPQLICCALVAVWVPEVGRGWVGASEQGGGSDGDQDSERRGGNKLEASRMRGIRPKQAGEC